MILLILVFAVFSSAVFAANTPVPENVQGVEQFKRGVKGDFQSKILDDVSAPRPDSVWYFQGEEMQGANISNVYNNFNSKRKIVVAVVDGGVDVYHEFLQGHIWTNDAECITDNGKIVADNNGIDDDGNGYIDDCFGWNFLGNIWHERLEITRLYKMCQDGKSVDSYGYTCDQIKKSYEDKVKEFEPYKQYPDYYAGIKNYYINPEYNERTFTMGEKYTDFCQAGKFYSNLPSLDDEDLILGSEGYMYQDNSDEVCEAFYGNNDVIGASPNHGTHVAGIITTINQNKNLEIMAVRVVPDGDERDIDVYNGIIYAVNNGANIISMSFGKGFSVFPQKVQEAIEYAEARGVLVVHAAGNDGTNNDEIYNYPRVNSVQSVDNSSYVEVGASLSLELSKTNKRTQRRLLANDSLIANFSNYGKTVDIFSPGVNILSSVTECTANCDKAYSERDYKQGYAYYDGTSMAAPVVSGIAALIMSILPSVDAKSFKANLQYNNYDKAYTNAVRLNGIIDAEATYNKLYELSVVKAPERSELLKTLDENVIDYNKGM